MAQAIRDYCRASGIPFRSDDDSERRLVRFVTETPAEDPRFREWAIPLPDLIETANKRSDGFEGLPEEDLIRVATLLKTQTERAALAVFLSIDALPRLDRDLILVQGMTSFALKKSRLAERPLP